MQLCQPYDTPAKIFQGTNLSVIQAINNYWLGWSVSIDSMAGIMIHVSNETHTLAQLDY